jgi:NADH-quinone oxidoreductase subunit C
MEKAGAGVGVEPKPPAPSDQSAAGPSERVRTIAPPTGPPDPPPPGDLRVPEFIDRLQSALPDAITQLSFWVGDWTIIVSPARLLDVAQHLRSDPAAQFDFCSDVTAADWPLRPDRFDVIYSLYSIRYRHRVRLKVRTGESVPSVTSLWPAANWLEREVFDMFGVLFDGHPDLRRILMPEEWQGHPQRKDYPLEGPGELLLENPMDWLRLRSEE